LIIYIRLNLLYINIYERVPNRYLSRQKAISRGKTAPFRWNEIESI